MKSLVHIAASHHLSPHHTENATFTVLWVMKSLVRIAADLQLSPHRAAAARCGKGRGSVTRLFYNNDFGQNISFQFALPHWLKDALVR